MAKKMSTAVLIMLLLLNGSATIMASSGLADSMGVNPNPGMETEMNKAIDAARDGFQANAGTVESFVSISISALSLTSILFNSIYAAPEMFLNLGLPAWFVLPVFAPMYIVVTLDLVFTATGRSL